MKLSKKDAAKAESLLLTEYRDAKCELDYDTAFHLLVAVVLSAQTTDKAVNRVTPALFAAAVDAFAMSKMEEEEIASFIKTLGLYRNKAKNLKKLAAVLVNEYGGIVPGSFEELVKLPGVGRKTANVMLAEAFDVPAIAVDTHVFRLANRIGLTKEDDVLNTELALQRLTPVENWTKLHHALIWHGRRVCSARRPDCESCVLKDICKKNF